MWRHPPKLASVNNGPWEMQPGKLVKSGPCHDCVPYVGQDEDHALEAV